MGTQTKKMTIQVKEILNHPMTNYRDKLVQIHTITGDCPEDCFKRVYAMRRSGRYDSDRRYALETKELEEKYQKWKEKNETIGMFYGSAVVD